MSFNDSVNNCPAEGGAKEACEGKKSMETVLTSGEIEAPVKESEAEQFHESEIITTAINPNVSFFIILFVNAVFFNFSVECSFRNS